MWSPVYVDAMILRERDTDANGTLDERLYVQHDANFNVTALLDTSGNVVERYIYDPFGAATVLNESWVAQTGSSYDWVYLHQGGRYDADSGMYHFRNRDFSPTLGRWNKNDPIGFSAGDVNLYRGLGNAVVNVLDPSGLDVWDWIARRVNPDEVDRTKNLDDKRSKQLRLKTGGQDITKSLINGLKELERKWSILHIDKKRCICNAVFSYTLDALVAWEIQELIGNSGQTHFSDGQNYINNTVTVNGSVYTASAVNYILYGKITKLCSEAELFGALEFDSRKIDPGEAATTLFAYRFVKQLFDGQGFVEQMGWWQAGYDFNGKSIAAPTIPGLYSDVSPSTKKYSGTLNWRLGGDFPDLNNIIIQFDK